MDELAWPSDARLVIFESEVEREFTERLADLTNLAFRVAFSVLRHREDAEDVAQEAMLIAYRKCRSLREWDRLRSWIVRIAWRRAIDRRRGDERRERREEQSSAASSGPSPEDVAASRELKRYLWLAIDELPEPQRKALILAAIEGHDTRSVAKLMNLPPGTVKSRLHNARKRLLEKLKWIVIGSDRI